jgi:hypothetical protein
MICLQKLRLFSCPRDTLANKGHDTTALQTYLDHRNLRHTIRETELRPTRFKDFWRD